MKNTEAIENALTALQFAELERFMFNVISESMKSLPPCGRKGVVWYKGCGFEDYFAELDEIWSDGEFVGCGIDTVSNRFVLNDETRPDFERAFMNALGRALAENAGELLK